MTNLFDKKEEKQKDEILQKINDILEEYEWGGKAEKKMILSLVFKGKFVLVENRIIIRNGRNLTQSQQSGKI